MNKQLYPTDMTDSQWDIIQQLIPPAKSGGRPRTLDMRQVINAILYLVVSGIQWRMLPKDYPKWQSVYYYFSLWRDDGTWQQMHDTLSVLIGYFGTRACSKRSCPERRFCRQVCPCNARIPHIKRK